MTWSPLSLFPVPPTCLVAGDDMDAIVHHLRSYFVDLVAGPVAKNGAEGPMTSVYLRDPDQKLDRDRRL